MGRNVSRGAPLFDRKWGLLFLARLLRLYSVSMVKYTVIVFLTLLTTAASADVDWTLLKNTDPPRIYWSDGQKIEEHLRKAVHQRDLDPNGWRYNLREWMMMVTQPQYKRDKVHGSNGGWGLA